MAFYVFCDDNCRYEGMTKEQIIAAIAEATGSAPTAIDDAFITKLKEIRAGDTAQLWIGTEADFNALDPQPIINKSSVRIGADGIMYICTDESLNSKAVAHAETHAADGDDPISPESIGAAKASESILATLAADGWTNNTQTVAIEGMTAEKNGIAGLTMNATTEEINAAAGAKLQVTEQAEGTITISALGSVPAIDIPIVITLMG